MCGSGRPGQPDAGGASTSSTSTASAVRRPGSRPSSPAGVLRNLNLIFRLRVLGVRFINRYGRRTVSRDRTSDRGRGVKFVLLATLLACAVPPASAGAAGEPVQIWLTTTSGNGLGKTMSCEPSRTFGSPTGSVPVVNVDPATTYQS